MHYLFIINYIFFPLVCLQGQSEIIEVNTVEQRLLRGELESLTAQSVTLRTGGVRTVLEPKNIITIRWPNRLRTQNKTDFVVQLYSEDVFFSESLQGKGDTFQLHWPPGVEHNISLDLLHRLLNPRRTADANFQFFASAQGQDRLYRRSGEALDFINGTIHSFEDKEIVFDSILGTTNFALEETAAVVLTSISPLKGVNHLVAVIELKDWSESLAIGAKLIGQIQSLENNKIEINLSHLGKLQIPLEHVFAIHFRNGNYTYLSTLTPTNVEEGVPFADAVAVQFPYQKDHSVTGRPLRVGGVEYFHGLGVHSRSVLSFTLDKTYRIFRTKVGIDDEVLELSYPGSVVFRIRTDQNLVHETEIVRGGMGAITIPDISLQGISQLQLEVDYADNLHIADRADWLEPVLIP